MVEVQSEQDIGPGDDLRGRRVFDCSSPAPLAGSIGLACLLLLATGPQLKADSGLFVTTTNDSGPGSLRQAIADATLLPDPIIQFPGLSGTIVLTSGQLTIASTITIEGPGAERLSISGNFSSRVLAVASNAGQVHISGLSIVNGRAYRGTDCSGGGIEVDAGARVTLADCIIASNQSGTPFASHVSQRWMWSGGGIHNSGVLRLFRCCISENKAGNNPGYWYPGGDGGGVYNRGLLYLEACTLHGNEAGRGGDGGGSCVNPSGTGGSGGGLCNLGTATLVGCTLHHNVAGPGGNGCGADSGAPGRPGGDGAHGGHGGGIFSTGALTLSNCTLVANSSGHGGDGGQGGLGQFVFDGGDGGSGGDSGNGGGLFNAGYLTLVHSTLIDNIAPPAGQGGEGGPATTSPGMPGPGGLAGSPGNGGGLFTEDAAPSVAHSILARNSAAGTCADVAGSIFSRGFNLVQTTNTLAGLVSTDLAGLDAMLGSLADHQGPTLTAAPAPGSPVLDRIAPDQTAPTDQRGLPRPAGEAADIGAFELQPRNEAIAYTNDFAFQTSAGLARLSVQDGPGGGATLLEPAAIATDHGGNRFFAEAGTHTIRRITPAGFVETIAGTPGRSGFTDGTNHSARFFSPRGIVVAEDGTKVYVADTGNHAIRCLQRQTDRAWTVTTVAGAAGIAGFADGPAEEARFSSPHGLTLGPAGQLYVADTANHVVRKLETNGSRWIVSLCSGTPGNPGFRDGPAPAAGFKEPTGLAFDPAESLLYVADRGNHAIRALTVDGTASTIAGSPHGEPGHADGAGTIALFHAPTGVSIDGEGQVHVADSRNHIIRKLVATGIGRSRAAQWQVTTLAGMPGINGSANGNSGARFDTPTSVAPDVFGNVFVADLKNHLIRRVSPAGTVARIAGTLLNRSAGYLDDVGSLARFHAPSAIAVHSNGLVYATDTANHVVRQMSPDGWVTTLAGTGWAGATDGLATDASFDSPQGIALGDDGSILVADTGNHTLRRVTAEGYVTTIVGIAGSAGIADGAAATAHFQSPRGVAAGPQGQIFIADTGNHTIRIVRGNGPGLAVETIAGLAAHRGTNDGSGAEARFDTPWALAYDAVHETVFVADRGNQAIRVLKHDGTAWRVRTLAGNTTLYGLGRTDGPAATARFDRPAGLALDRSGILYISEQGNHSIRQLTRRGDSWLVNTVAGLPRTPGCTDADGANTSFCHPSGLATDALGNLWVADTGNNVIRHGVRSRRPLQGWQEANFGHDAADELIAGPDADPDGDLLPNLAEYALGTNPNLPAATGWPSGNAQWIDGANYLTLAFPRAIAATDISYLVEIADSLGTGEWRNGSLYHGPDATHFLTTEVSRMTNGAIESIVVRDRAPMESGTNRFMRLRLFLP